MHIFRLGGIYGPGRSALDSAAKEVVPRALAGTAPPARVFARVPEEGWIIKKHEAASRECITRAISTSYPNSGPHTIVGVQEAGAAQARRGQQRYTNRCHVYDICQVLLASMQQPQPGAASIPCSLADNAAAHVEPRVYILTCQNRFEEHASLMYALLVWRCEQ